MNSTLRKAVALVVALPLTIGLATSAQAKTNVNAKSSGNYATIQWDSTTTDASGATTYLSGYLDVRGTKVIEVQGNVDIVTCPEGVEPWSGDDEACDYGGGWIEAASVKLSMDKKLTRATISGTANYFSWDGEGEGGMVAEPVDVTLTGVGGITTTRENHTYTDENGVSYRFRSTDTGRAATVSGSFAGHDLADAYGSFGTFKNAERLRIP